MYIGNVIYSASLVVGDRAELGASRVEGDVEHLILMSQVSVERLGLSRVPYFACPAVNRAYLSKEQVATKSAVKSNRALEISAVCSSRVFTL